MKLILLLLIITSQAFASISSEEKTEALGSVREVMMTMARATPDSKFLHSSVVDEMGTRLIVEFSFRDVNGALKCSFAYDRVLKKIIKDSATCDL
jgi:hypothetical protein